MDCKKSRELILTDYLDDRMDRKEKARIEEHMARCPGCKRFFIDAKETAGEPFLNAERLDPPEYLWRRVREAIRAEEEKKAGFVSGLLERWRALLYIPKPALAIISILMLILAAGAFFSLKSGGRLSMDAGMSGEAEYFAYLTETSANTPENGNGGFGTSIERYFL